MTEKTDKKPGLMDYGLQVLRMLLGDKPANADVKPAKTTIEDIKLDDLNKEQVRLDQEKRKLLMELRQIESDKRKFFEDGVKNSSERERAAIAREIKSLDMKAQNKDRILRSIEKQKQIIDGLILIKERARLMNESGLASVIGNMDLGDLIQYVDRASVDGEFHMRKFDEVLRTLGQADSLSPEMSEDADVLDILKQMEEARMAADNPQVIEEHYQKMNQEITQRSLERAEGEDEL